MRRPIKKRWSTDQLITGIDLQKWLELLQKNEYRVGPEYFHRAAWVTAWSLPATIAGKIEEAKFGARLRAMTIDPTPIFILGHWRSGTTHLHNCLFRDPNHTTSTTFQVVFPGSFLTLGDVVPKLTAGLLDETRTYDNVKFGWDEAAEDEIALAKMTGLSPYISFMFPEHARKYEKYVDFQQATEAERKQWKDAFEHFIKKMMLASGGKRAIIKSCTHSARIRLLLEMFPDAKFIHIHRHPYKCFASTLHMRSHTDWENFFHLPEESVEGQRTEQTALMGAAIFERLIEDQKLIPEQNFFEIAYRDFVGHEHDVLRQIYQQFELPGWAQYEEVLLPYLESLKGYKTNRLQMSQETKDMVWDRWRIMFDHYGYPREYDP